MDRMNGLSRLVVLAIVGLCFAGCARMSNSEWAASLNDRLGPVGDGSGWTPIVAGEPSDGGDVRVVAQARVASVLVRPEDAEHAWAQIYVVVRWADGEEHRGLNEFLDDSGTGFTRSGSYSLEISLTDLDGVVRACPNSTIRFPPMMFAQWYTLVGVGDPNAVGVRIDRLVCRSMLDPRAVGLDLRIGVDEVKPLSWVDPSERLRWAAPLTAHGVKGRSKHIGGRRWILYDMRSQ